MHRLHFSSDEVGGAYSNHFKASEVNIIELSFFINTELCPDDGKHCALNGRILVRFIKHIALLH
jgi:hypothetical protein